MIKVKDSQVTKLLAAILFSVYFLLCFVSCNAERATIDKIILPGGLEFAMSIEEAQSVSKYTKRIAENTAKIVIDKMGFNDEYLSGSATVGGNAAHIEVYFDKTGLKQVAYEFTLPESKGNADDDQNNLKESYIKVENQLISKYGQEVESNSKHMYSPVTFITGDFSSSILGKVSYMRFGISPDNNNDYNATYIALTKDGGCYYIDHTGYIWSLNMSSFGFTNELTYTYYDTIPSTEEPANNAVDF